MIRIDDELLLFGVDFEQNVFPLAGLVVLIFRADALGRVLTLFAVARVVGDTDRDVVSQLVHVAELNVVHVDLVRVERKGVSVGKFGEFRIRGGRRFVRVTNFRFLFESQIACRELLRIETHRTHRIGG